MSTTYRTETPVSWDNFFSRLPENIWVHEDPTHLVTNANNGSYQKCLTDGEDYLWVFTINFEKVFFEKYGNNFVDDMIASLEDALEVRIFSEHHPEYETSG